MKTKQKILLVDDDIDILDLLKYNLEREGYIVKTEIHSKNAINTAIAFEPDLIILDIMMPQLNGIEVCSQLRSFDRFQKTYIFFLSAKSEQYLQYEAFAKGGDDYIEKITGLRALTYKLETVLKKDLVIRKSVNLIYCNGLKLDRETKSVMNDNKQIVLPKHEFELLYFLAQNPHKEITSDHLVHNIWGSEMHLLSKSMDTYVESISRKIGKQIIKKVGNMNYRLAVN